MVEPTVAEIVAHYAGEAESLRTLLIVAHGRAIAALTSAIVFAFWMTTAMRWRVS